ncbi:hypothetical protein ACVDG3_22595 [Meridianimarinicoccus sp. RP-17]|uniref:hypothetical protein n=1 Tax=Meridianimarinicoccus zhengii TaxID=2056810 RepID=UPI0013A6DF3C|nr:hypothetical protein [Phycocomes zhengii]
MQAEPILSYHNIDRSSAVDDLGHRRIEMPERHHDRITGREVTLEFASSRHPQASSI